MTPREILTLQTLTKRLRDLRRAVAPIVAQQRYGSWTFAGPECANLAKVYKRTALPKYDIQKAVDDFGTMSLEQLRLGREVALQQGNIAKAFALATAIDRKRGLY